jgi:hypothetical protein
MVLMAIQNRSWESLKALGILGTSMEMVKY